MGPHRVWLGDVWLPGLAMSRAMGDTMARRYAITEHFLPVTSLLHILPKLEFLAGTAVMELHRL